MASIASLLFRLRPDSAWADVSLGDRVSIIGGAYAGLHARLAFFGAGDDDKPLFGMLLEPRGEVIWWLDEEQVEICDCADAESAPMPDSALAIGVLQQLVLALMRDDEDFALTTIATQEGRMFRASVHTQNWAPRMLFDRPDEFQAHGRDPLEALGALVSTISASQPLPRP